MKKEGKIPVNARITVDYSQKKPKINFSYPRKDVLNQNRFGLHTLIIMVLAYSIMISCYYIFFMPSVDYPSECNITLDKGYANITIIIDGYEDNKNVNITTNKYKQFIKGVDFQCDNGDYNLTFNRYDDSYGSNSIGFHDISEYKANYNIWIILISPLILSILFNEIFIRWAVKRKWFKEKIPLINAWTISGRKKYKKFTVKDLKDDYVEIPFFRNIELNFKSKGDFSKFLEKVDIKEHDFHYVKIKRNKKLIKKERNIQHWSARFYFSENPKNGYLEVAYR